MYRKFLSSLQASGVHVVPDGPQLHIMAMTNSDVDHLAGDREIQSPETVRLVKDEFQPIDGGLFDPNLTGGMDESGRWAKISFPEPMPNPVMEEPIRRLLGLTEKQFEETLAGNHKLPQGTGPEGMQKALEAINVDREIMQTRVAMKTARKTRREELSRKLGYLKSAKKLGISPSDWMLTKAPVLPPQFRPISLMQQSGLPLVSDANWLYKELLEARDNLKTMKGQSDDVGDERVGLYKAFKAVTGLGDPLHPKLRDKHISGILKGVFGCYDDETEILTRKYGWVRFPDLTVDTEVATLNPSTGAFEWQQPTEYQRYDFSGEMIRLQHGRRIDLLLTPNHRNWVRRQCRNLSQDEMAAGWEFELAIESAALGGRRWFRTAPDSWAGHQERPAFLPDSCDLGAFAEFIGWCLAEGTWGGEDHPNRVVVYQSRKHPRFCEMIEAAVAATGLPYNCYDGKSDPDNPIRVWHVNSKEFAAWLLENCGRLSHGLKLSEWIRDWDRPLLERLARGYLGGDGTKKGTRKPSIKHRNNCNETGCSDFKTISCELADDMAEVLTKLGLTMQIASVPVREGRKPQWIGKVSGSRFTVVEGFENCIEEYHGEVHCCTVPNGILYVRRNGKPVFSGNSSPKTSMVQQKLIGSTTDLVGRGVIVPNPDLDMDSIGIPESKAWDIYRPFIVRRLSRRGMPMGQALEHVEKKSPLARQQMLDEMDERLVMMDRAPILHRFGALAFRPRLTKDEAVVWRRQESGLKLSTAW